MSWIDIRVRKPTKDDADKFGKVLQMMIDGSVCVFDWRDLSSAIAWMAVPEFDPAPDPPEGYRLLERGEPFRKDAKWYANDTGLWFETCQKSSYDPFRVYCVPIDKPQPTYRPFTNGDEFEPFADRWLRRKGSHGSRSKVSEFTNDCIQMRGVWRSWQAIFNDWEFTDGTPCGVLVE